MNSNQKKESGIEIVLNKAIDFVLTEVEITIGSIDLGNANAGAVCVTTNIYFAIR
jgi:hypothetical protein